MRRAALLVIASWLSLTPLLAQDAPDAEAARQAARDYARAVADWNQAGIGTGLPDAVTDLSILDDYNPVGYAPMGEMPRLPERGYLLVRPGRYALEAASFCLHAGAFAPGGGDGYALAPLKGMGGEITRAILERWLAHPEIAQQDIQLLLWAIDERVHPDKLSPELAAEARTLLTEEEIASWREFARGEEPKPPQFLDEAEVDRAQAEMQNEIAEAYSPDLMARLEELQQRLVAVAGDPDKTAALMAEMDRIAAEMQTASERVGAAMEGFNQRFGPMLEAQTLAYDELAAQLAPEGDPAPPPGSREIPASRWSYDAGGFFIRFVPLNGYSRSLVEVSLPGPHGLTRDADGRVAEVAARDGSRVSFTYAGVPEPVAGEPGVRSCRLRSVTYTPADGRSPTWEGEGLATVGVPVAEGSADLPGAGVPLAALRSLQADLVRTAGAVLGTELPAYSVGPALADALDLASLAGAVRQVTGYTPEPDPGVAWEATEGSPELSALTIVQEALLWSVRLEVESFAGPAQGVRPAAWHESGAPFVPASLASVSSGGGSINPANRVAQPGNTGRQRLGLAPRPSDYSVDKSALKKAMLACDMIKDLLDIANGVMDPVGWLIEKVGLGQGIPGMLFDKLLSTIFEVATEISKALGGDPPRADYTSFSFPPAPELPRLVAEGNLSPQRAAAGQAVLDALVAWYAEARRAQICLDRMGGADQAGAEEWVWAQADGVVHYKRETGLRMIELADALDQLRAVFEEEGAEDRTLTTDRVEEQLAAMKSGELTDLDREAARIIGVDEQELIALRKARTGAPAEDLHGASYLGALEELATGLREGGAVWSRLPEVPAPGEAAAPVA